MENIGYFDLFYLKIFNIASPFLQSTTTRAIHWKLSDHDNESKEDLDRASGGPPAQYPGGPPASGGPAPGGRPLYPGGPPAQPVNYPMFPTDADFENFQCFNDSEIAAIRDEFGFTEKAIGIWSKFPYKSDDWSIQSFVSSILFREVMGCDVQLYQFQEGAATIIGSSNDSVIFHWEMAESQLGMLGPGTEKMESQVVLHQRWMMRSDVVQLIEAELETEITLLYLDILRTFTHSAVIEAMNTSDEIAIDADEDGQFACTAQHGCNYGDSTWYPPQCDFTTNAHRNCTVLLQFLPEHDSEMNRNLIIENELPIVIKYLGNEKSTIGQSNFHRFYEERSRVIFQLRSTEIQSTPALDWTMIALPADGDLIEDETIFHLYSAPLSALSLNQMITRHQMKLQQSQIDTIKQAIFVSPEPETTQLRLEKSCDWIRNPINQQYGWHTWFKYLDSSLTEPECDYNAVTDESSEWVYQRSYDELIAGVLADITYYSKIDGIRDAYDAIYFKCYCIYEAENENLEAMLIGAYTFAGLALSLLLAVAAATIKWSRQAIIMAASIPMLMITAVGCVMALCFSLSLKMDNAAHCVARKYIFQIGMGLMFGGLATKTWKLHKMLENQKLLIDVWC